MNKYLHLISRCLCWKLHPGAVSSPYTEKMAEETKCPGGPQAVPLSHSSSLAIPGYGWWGWGYMVGDFFFQYRFYCDNGMLKEESKGQVHLVVMQQHCHMWY